MLTHFCENKFFSFKNCSSLRKNKFAPRVDIEGEKCRKLEELQEKRNM